MIQYKWEVVVVVVAHDTVENKTRIGMSPAMKLTLEDGQVIRLGDAQVGDEGTLFNGTVVLVVANQNI